MGLLITQVLNGFALGTLYVLMALGRSADGARDGVRFSLGRTNSLDEIERVVALTAAAVRRIRQTRRTEHGDA